MVGTGQTAAIEQELTAIVGAENVTVAENLPPSWRDRLASLSPTSIAPWLVTPHTAAELATIVASAHCHRWKLLPCGSGSKLNWGGLTSGADVLVSTAHVNRLIEHAVGDLTVTVEAGTRFAGLQAQLTAAGQFLAIDPAYPAQATIGGIVATGDTGSLRQRYGGVRDMLLGLSFARYDGQIAKAGGRVVKNVAGYDLMKLFTGSYGTLGILTQLTFRVYPLPDASQTIVLSGAAEAIGQVVTTILNSALTPTSLDVLSAQLVTQCHAGNTAETGLGLAVRFQSISASVCEQASRLLALGHSLGLASSSYVDQDEAALWQALREQMEELPIETAITCKIGIRASETATILAKMQRLVEQPLLALVHGGSGVGRLCLPDGTSVETLLHLRSLCQSSGGYLSVLQAPVALKQQVDVWGYPGNALNLMQTLKQQFDPFNLFSPHRFVGGI